MMNSKDSEKFSKLNFILKEIVDIRRAQAILIWDNNTHMPKFGAAMRGRQLATLGKIAHEKFIHPEVGTLLRDLEKTESLLPYSSDEACLLRYVKIEYEKSTKLSPEFVSMMMEHQAVCYDKWIEAKAENNFKMIVPYLEKTLEHSLRYAEHFKYDHIADPLISESDYGFTAKSIQNIFVQLRSELLPIVADVLSRPSKEESLFTNLSFPIALQEKFVSMVAAEIGYDFNRGRIDQTPHPFMIAFSRNDVRITTRFQENDITDGLFSVIHEAGHALYELGIAENLDGTMLGEGTSSGVHESQSRLWENLVGRRFEFWEYFYPKLRSLFPEQFSKISLNQFYAQINKVKKSLIRVDADELTYNLHVMIRFHLELQMLEGKLKVKDLNEAWNAEYKKDLGLDVPSDSLGCLQDVHWYSSLIGGQFQGYTLGNIMSAQFYGAANLKNSNLKNEIRQGNFSFLRLWLNENLHRHGKKYPGLEVLKMATGEDLTIAPYVNYLKGKFSKL